MNEREQVRLRKVAELPKPWTHDPILQNYKFTNVNREHDRTTQWMRKYWTGPNIHKSPEMQFFNCALFRYFGTVEFATAVGWQDDFNPTHIKKVAKELVDKHLKCFTGAYVITNGGIKAPKQNVVVDMYLTPLYHALPILVQVAQETKSWQEVHDHMRELPGFGGTGFMTKEVLQDVIHGTTVFPGEPVDLNTWCPAGPGARRGLNVIYGREMDKTLNEQQALKEMLELFSLRHSLASAAVLETGFDLHCIQFQLCEWAKYVKVRDGLGRPRSRYEGV
jgi:hypothetical protein